MKTLLYISLLAAASIGTYLLSHRIESGISSAASVFLSRGSSHQISVFADKAEPAAVTARIGDEIVFMVKDDSRHNIAEERTQRREARLESGEIGKDESYSLVFQSSGAFSFYDRLNQDIHVAITIR
ncbi:hypothetical protein KW799_00440 [Candidatus Parcubacteria bacterium]|nr:hypothetical protein [Candidatus Parcubacteria bacterium]